MAAEKTGMKSRFLIFDGERVFANVHARNALEAIKIACSKVRDHDPRDCVARSVHCNGCIDADSDERSAGGTR